MTHGAGSRADDDDGALGVLHAVGVHAGHLTAADLRPGGEHFVDDRLGGVLGAAACQLGLHDNGAVGVVAVCDGLRRGEQAVGRLVGAHELRHGGVVHELAALVGVARGEAVERGENRQHDLGVLSNAEGAHRVVVGLLGVLGKHYDPTGVAHAHDVGVVGVDVDGRRDGAVDVGHDDGQAHAGGDGQLLVHERKALRGGRSHGARAGSRRADGGAHGRVLALDVDVLGVHAAIGHELVELLDDDGLGRDGVRRHDIGLSLAQRVGDHDVAGCCQDGLGCHYACTSLCFASCSLTMEMAPNLHSRAHTPQPLQCS